MQWYLVSLGALGLWRVTHLLAAEDGPWNLVARMRAAAGQGFLGQAMDCFNCLSIWLAIPFALVLASGWSERVLLWLALSGAAILIERLTGALSPAAYIEDDRPAEE